MTTWDEPTYTTDLHSCISRFLTGDEKIYSKIIKKVPIRLANLIGIQHRDEDTLNDWHIYKRLFPNACMNRNEFQEAQFAKICDESDIIHTGIDAIYKLFVLCWNEKITYSTQIPIKQMTEALTQYTNHDSYISYNTAKRIKSINEVLRLPDKNRHYYTRYMSLSNMFHHMGYFNRTASYQNKIHRAKTQDSTWPECLEFPIGNEYKIYLFNTIIIIVREHEVDDKRIKTTFILEPKSNKRLIMLLRSVAKFSIFWINDKLKTGNSKGIESWKQYMDMMSESMEKSTRPNEIAKAYDVGLYVYLAKHASDLDDRSLRQQNKKWEEGKYYEIYDLRLLQRIADAIPFMNAIDLLKTYKMLPCPDYDPSTGFLDNCALQKQQWSFAKLPESEKELQISVEDFRAYQKLQIIRRFSNYHGQCPGKLNELGIAATTKDPNHALVSYPLISQDKIKIAHMSLIDIRGAGQWDPWDMNSPAHYTDKAAPPQHISMDKIISGTDYSAMNIRHKSFLGFYMSEQSIPHGDALRFSYNNKLYKNEQRADFKPESKKPAPRNFFSAPPYFRLIRAEFESNVSRYIDRDNSSITGKSPTELATQLSKIFTQKTEKNEKQKVFISFDLDKFSPKMPEGTSELANSIWMELFNQPYMSSVWDFYKNNTTHFFHNGIHQKSENSFCDFEGQLGKCNTAFHIDLMAYAVRQLRKLRLITDPGALYCLIDDGLLSLTLEKSKISQTLPRILSVIEATYHFFGLRISWDKTFVSSNMAMFLNEIWYKGQKYAGGVKAILKMQPQKLQDELSIIGKIKGLVAMSQGCVKAGLEPHLAAAELFRESYLLADSMLSRQTNFRKATPLAQSLFFILPIAYGGLGLPPCIQLMGVSGTMSPRLFIDTIIYVTASFPNTRTTYEKLIKQRCRKRKIIDVLRNPTGIRRESRTMTEWKHLTYLSDAIRTSITNVKAKAILTIDVEACAKATLYSLPQPATADEVMAAYKSSPIHAFDELLGKFKRSQTIFGFLTFRQKARILARYGAEIRDVWDKTHTFITGVAQILS